MTSRTLLNMWDPERNYIIRAHEFYVEQAEKRILSQFNNLDDEVEQIAQEIYDKSGAYFNPDYDDPGDYVEAAYEKAQDHIMLLCEMRDQTLFSIIAGMYHQFDKTLRGWLERESRYWAGDKVKEQLWKVDIGKLYKLFEDFGWDITKEPFFRYLDACRLIVNVYKHGKGKALIELRKEFPEYFYDFNDESLNIDGWYDHYSIRISDEQFKMISKAVIDFWNAIPERIIDTDDLNVPQWLLDALKAENK